MIIELVFLVSFLGLFTYFILKRSIPNITRTPIWILWLVMMAPPLIWSYWILVYGNKPPPPALVIIPFVISPFLYWLLIQLGRYKTPKIANNSAQDLAPTEITKDSPEPLKLFPFNKEEETNLRNCFPWSIFYLENLDYKPQAIFCTGKLRSNPELAYRTIYDNINLKFGDRFLVLFQEDFNAKPFFTLVPNPQAENVEKITNQSVSNPFIALILLIISLFTATIGGMEMAGISSNNWLKNPDLWMLGLPYSLSIIVILGIYESSQYLMARFYKMQMTLPYFIPIPPLPFLQWNLGTFGAFIQKISRVPHRKALFDIAIIGPIVGFLVIFPCLFWGLAHSSVVPLSEKSSIFNIHALDPRYSLLLTLLSKWALGSKFTPQMAINLNLVAIAGYIGFIWTTFKLIPVGQLDGGNIVHAMFGQRKGIIISQITWLLMLLRAFIHPDFLILAVMLFFIPLNNKPALNDVSELDNGRDALGLIALAILVSILLPVPESIANLLHI